MSESSVPDTEKPAVIFKSKKNRKQLRTRPTPIIEQIDAQPSNSATTSEPTIADENTSRETAAYNNTSASAPAPAPSRKDDNNNNNEDEHVLVKAKKSRLKGVAFRAVELPKDVLNDESESTSNTLILAGVEKMALAISEDLGGLNNGGIKRFAPQTGVMGASVNMHMEQYVESQLARRHNSNPDTSVLSNTQQPTKQPISVPTLPNLDPEGKKPTRSGKLMEIDLGDEARRKNMEMLERVKRQIAGDKSVDDPTGKRQRCDRRGSEEIKRDRFVEDFMSKNKLDVYDVPTSRTAAAGHAYLGADERVAAQFRRDFAQAASQRVRRGRSSKTMSTHRPGAKKDAEILRGPKLGGSRNVRAQMRDILLQQQEEKAKASKTRPRR